MITTLIITLALTTTTISTGPKLNTIKIDNIITKKTTQEIKSLISKNLAMQLTSKYPTQAPLRKKLDTLAKKFTQKEKILYNPILSEKIINLCRFNYRARYIACGGDTHQTWEEETTLCINIGYLRFLHCYRVNYERAIEDEPILANCGFSGLSMGIELQRVEKNFFEKVKDKIVEFFGGDKKEKEITSGEVTAYTDLFDKSDPDKKKKIRIELESSVEVCGRKAESVFSSRKIYVILGLTELENLIVEDYRIMKDPDLKENRNFLERDGKKDYFWLGGEQYYRQDDGKVFYWDKGRKVYVDEEKLMSKVKGGRG